jgi:outer membrane protein assembly factor BamB
VFVLNSPGELRSFDAATGAAGWTVQLTGQSSFSSVPVAVNGLVYVSGAGGGGTVYALSQADGAVVWSAQTTAARNLTVSRDGLFATSLCRVTKFNPLTGEVLWYYSTGCSGGGEMMGVYADNRLYVRRLDPAGGPFSFDNTNAVFDATTGAKLSVLQTNVVPAIAAGRGFQLNGTTLTAIDLGTGATLWSFTGDLNLVSAPLAIDNVVVIGSKLGAVYMLDRNTGNVLWSGQVAAGMGTADQYGVVAPSSGLGLGNGYLLVPAGNTLVGWKMVP